MPRRQNAIKALRINHKRHMANQQIKTDLKKVIKNYKGLIADKKLDEAKTALKDVYKKLDKATKRNVLQKNTAARRKSFFSRLLTTKKA